MHAAVKLRWNLGYSEVKLELGRLDAGDWRLEPSKTNHVIFFSEKSNENSLFIPAWAYKLNEHYFNSCLFALSRPERGLGLDRTLILVERKERSDMSVYLSVWSLKREEHQWKMPSLKTNAILTRCKVTERKAEAEAWWTCRDFWWKWSSLYCMGYSR